MDLLILEVVIGLSFLFFVLSIVTSAVNEAIAGLFKLRARMLEQAIVNLVTGAKGDEDPAGRAIVTELYEHSVINGYGSGRNKPSYLSSRSFRNALLDVTTLLEATEEPAGDPVPAEEIRRQVDESLSLIESENLRKTLTTIWRAAGRDAPEFRAGVERWFDRGMDRASGWYKRRAQVILFVVGMALAAGINADAVQMTNRLWADDAVREALVAQADSDQDEVSADTIDRLGDIGVPLGWGDSTRPDDTAGWIVAVVGWFLTGIAVSFGAPFWFDLLNKVANLRSAGRKPASVLTPAPPGPTSSLDVSVSTEPNPP
jgi:hypothetical protein